MSLTLAYLLQKVSPEQNNSDHLHFHLFLLPRGVAIQCRVTTENPERDFAPDTGRLTLYRHSAGCGVRMDGVGYSGYVVTPYFDSMIVKYTVRGSSFKEAVARMKRVLQECRIRGVKTNIGFLMNVLAHPEFNEGSVTTSFIDENPQLKMISQSRWDYANEQQADPRKVTQTDGLLRYLANLAVNGHPKELGADSYKMTGSCTDTIKLPEWPEQKPSANPGGMRKILLEQGPAGYAKAVREHEGLLLTDTTWRDAHQSLLATRMRTQELQNCADYTNKALSNAFSLEVWGGYVIVLYFFFFFLDLCSDILISIIELLLMCPCDSFTNVLGIVLKNCVRLFLMYLSRCY